MKYYDDNAHIYRGADIALNRAIILRAILDAIGQVDDVIDPTEVRVAKSAARAWFRYAPEEFKTVCDCAGLNWEAVRAVALRRMKEADGKT